MSIAKRFIRKAYDVITNLHKKDRWRWGKNWCNILKDSAWSKMQNSIKKLPCSRNSHGRPIAPALEGGLNIILILVQIIYAYMFDPILFCSIYYFSLYFSCIIVPLFVNVRINVTSHFSRCTDKSDSQHFVFMK